MSEQTKPQTHVEATLDGPRVLTLYPTTSCAVECAPCYLKSLDYGQEKPLRFFEELIGEAARTEHIRRIHLSVNVDPPGGDTNRRALHVLSRAAHAAGLTVLATTNYENVHDWGAREFALCQHVALSVDEYKFPRLRLPSDFFEQVTRLQAEGPVVSLNLLLSHRLLAHLTLPRLRRWLGLADQVSLLIPKHYTLDFSRQELLDLFDRLAPLWEEPDRFFHLQVDSCIKPQVFPWNQLYPSCEWADEQINILPDGQACFCAMDKPFATLQDSRELPDVVQAAYVEQHQEGRSICPFIEFADR